MSDSEVIHVGAELQRAREARGLALYEVAQQLKFAPRHLEALEQDRFDLLPGATFARGMVRSYARLLKIDPEPLVRSIGERFDAPDASTLAARYRQPVPFSDGARRSTFVYLGLSLGVLAVVGGVAWQWYHERGKAAVLARGQSATQLATAALQTSARVADKPAELPPAPAPAPRAAAVPPPKRAEKVVEAPPAPPPPVALKPPADEATVAKAAIERPLPVAKVAPGVHRLVIRCAQAAWIEVRDDDDRALISSLNPAGAERALRARGPLNLIIGNARHVTVLHNDRPLDLAPYIKGETARFTLP
jgi:cytoskeleton protein RodZ